MNRSIVLTVIADDKPGIVKRVSEAVKKHGGNWNQSSMSALAGQFAGILLVNIPSANADACLEELSGLESEGLRIIAHVSREAPEAGEYNEHRLELVGNDRPGIVHEITTLLAGHGVNVQNLETLVESASMSGGDLFRAYAHLLVPKGTDLAALEAALEATADDLMVDITFER